MGNERIRLTVLIALFAFTLAVVHQANRHRMAEKRLPVWEAVPYEIGGWSGRAAAFDNVYAKDPADTSLLRAYVRGGQPPVIAYVGFYGDLATILEVHTPELCYPAQGWSISFPNKPSDGTFRGQPIPAREIVVDKSGDRRFVMWWYNAGSRPLETRIRYIYAMLAMSTLTGRTDGSMVRLETPIEKNDESGARFRIEEFRKSFLPALDQALPR